MIERNQSSVTEFILLGLTDNPELQLILFLLFLMFYITTLVCNIGIIVLTRVDSHLHTPMYFFLCHLSFVDLCYSSTISPKMLVSFLSDRKSISLNDCIAQLYFFAAFATSECFLVTVMAYDRYVAICNPLLYPVAMSQRVCIQLVAGAYAASFIISMAHTVCTFYFPFCQSNVIDHFYCDIPPVLELSCPDSNISKVIIFFLAISLGFASLSVILSSYVSILSAILRIHSASGRRKAFNTCASHLTVVLLFYGSVLFMYMRPSSFSSVTLDKFFSLFYTVFSPMLNPLIYSLRNNEVKEALRKVVNGNI
ncbi:olfactory receptor 1009-like [Rhinatrema bivittatum]|uniref:olfactory receptor 1009-like n=1 Tax=Rhinatrema bivittatum TaxID=194408 RepID=UPI001125B4B3|nr:olfactory receptor 1009-like [Rhinatrema bivittatum]